jgi:hypothetical protein
MTKQSVICRSSGILVSLMLVSSQVLAATVELRECTNLASQYPKYFVEEPIASKKPHEIRELGIGNGGLDDEYWWYSENGKEGPWIACTYKLETIQFIFSDDQGARIYTCGNRKIRYDKHQVDVDIVDKLGIARLAKNQANSVGKCNVAQKVRLLGGLKLDIDERATTFYRPLFLYYKVEGSDFTFTIKKLFVWTIKEKTALPKPVF